MTTARGGVVYLVGAGPGDPELVTRKAAALLATADVVLHDDLVPQAILDLASRDRGDRLAHVVSVGKRCNARQITQQEINSLMIEHARRGRSVVRLKSGDPLIFGRAAEEIDALREAGVACEVVPGITAMFAAAAAVGKSLTDRRSASKVILTTAHHVSDATGRDRLSFWSGPLPADATLGIYMPGRDPSTLAGDMLAAGMAPELPCLAVSQVSLPEQRIDATSLGHLSKLKPGPAPLLVLAGWPLGDR